MPTALIYCPNTGGHRHMYAKAFVDYFLEKGFSVVFAYGGLLNSREPWPFAEHHSAFIASFCDLPQVTMLSLKGRFEQNAQVTLLHALQQEMNADHTVILDGDAIQWPLAFQLLPWRKRLRSNTVAVFLRSEFVYPEAISFLRLFEQWFLHAFLFKRWKLLQKHIWLDEIVVKTVDTSHYAFVPDIICDPEEGSMSEQDQWYEQRVADEVDQFVTFNQGKAVVLFFGAVELRKGLDYLLRLVCENSDLVLIVSGRLKPMMSYAWEQLLWRETLIKQGRILEIPSYLGSPALIHKLFSLPQVIALPYKYFYRTSGCMLHAIAHGKPVLVPRRGLINFRTTLHRVGLSYTANAYESFEAAFYQLLEHADDFKPALKTYAHQFSREGLHKAFDVVFGFSELSTAFDIPSAFPRRTLGHLAYFHLHHVWVKGRPFLSWFRKKQKEFILQWRILRHELVVRIRWKKVRGSVALFGAGQHTRWLLHVVSGLKGGPDVVVVLDDRPPEKSTISGIPVVKAADWSFDSAVTIVLSSDLHQEAMALRCNALFGDECQTLDLYAGLPPGPYPKAS